MMSWRILADCPSVSDTSSWHRQVLSLLNLPLASLHCPTAHRKLSGFTLFPKTADSKSRKFMEAQSEDQPMSDTDGFKESPRKWGADSAQPPSPSMTANGCFDCNICLDFAVDPVVTLCGHLYCWPCIYKWLELEGTTPQQCPVCKATLSETTLVPLYGRGNAGDKESYVNGRLDIPRRPSIQHRGQTLAASLVEPDFSQTALHRRRRHQHQHRHRHDRQASHYDHVNDGSQPLHGVPHLLGSAAVAVLPWVFGEHVSTGLQYSNRYYLVGDESSPGQRRQEMLARRSLHRIFVFLLCCMVLCLLLF